MNTKEDIHQLIERAERLGRSQEGIAAAEDAVRLADALEDTALGYQARDVLMENATFGGAPEKLLVAFSWCLAQADRDPNWDPDSMRAMMLLWRYKWVIANGIDFPGISRARLLQMVDDFRQRSRAAGWSERTALHLRFTVERRLGHFVAAQDWLAKVAGLSRDGLSDCLACEIDATVSFHAARGACEDAIREAAPILDGGMSCAEIPHKTHATLLECFRKTGRSEDAARSHAAGYRLVRSGRAFITQHGEHMVYLLRAGAVEKSVALLRRHLPWALEVSSGEERFRFLLAARELLRQLEANRVRSLRLRLDPARCAVAGRTTVRVAELRVWTEQVLRALAEQFDARNESAWFSQMLREGDSAAAAAA